MLRYADFLLAELTLRGYKVRLVTPPVVFGRLLRPNHRWSKWFAYLDKYLIFRLTLPWQIRQADVVHVCDHSNATYLPWIKRAQRLITCHDALAILSARGVFPENKTRMTGRKLQDWILRSLRSADRIVYVSEKTHEDFEQALRINNPYVVIPHALHWAYEHVSEASVDAALRSYGLQCNQYLLHVGSNVWYKNRLGVLKAYAAIVHESRYANLRVVMAGAGFSQELESYIREHNLEQVVSVVSPTNEQLRCLYSGALAFLFPSLQEGFGWPLLEAQACGCPVMTSNRAPMTEVTAGSSVDYDPERPEAAVAALDEVVAHREEYIALGEQNLKRFSVEAMMSEYEAVYRSLAESSNGAQPKTV